jgi:hypothetical protein
LRTGLTGITLWALRTYDMAGGAADEDLRRVGTVAETASIMILALGRRFQQKQILPAEPIPVGDMKC